MDIIFPMLLLLLAVLTLIIGLVLDQRQEHDHAVVILFIASMVLFFVAGGSMYAITETKICCPDYQAQEDYTFHEVVIDDYYPFGMFGIGLGIFCLVLIFMKTMSIYIKKGD